MKRSHSISSKHSKTKFNNTSKSANVEADDMRTSIRTFSLKRRETSPGNGTKKKNSLKDDSDIILLVVDKYCRQIDIRRKISSQKWPN